MSIMNISCHQLVGLRLFYETPRVEDLVSQAFNVLIVVNRTRVTSPFVIVS